MSRNRNRNGRKSAIDLWPQNIKQIFINLVENKRLTTNQVANKMAALGHPISGSAISRYAIKLRKGLKRLKDVGVSYAISNKHQEEFKELSWLLLEREILNHRSEEKEQEIKRLKERIPFFNQGES